MASQEPPGPKESRNSQNSSQASTQQDELAESQSQTTQQLSSETPIVDLTWGHLVACPGNPSNLPHSFVFGEKDHYTIGRLEGNDITIPVRAVSSLHCIISKDMEKNLIFLEDKSTNGTHVNKEKIHKSKTILSEGSLICLVPGSKKTSRKKVAYMFQPVKDGDESEKDELHTKYNLIKELGSGTFGTVHYAMHRSTGDEFAIKTISRSSWARMANSTRRQVDLMDEVNIMKRAKHPHVCGVHDVIEDADHVHLVMDLCAGGDMLEYLINKGEYSEQRGRKVFRQLLSAIQYLHDQRFVHRDLKPENILLVDKSGDEIRVSDFGASRSVPMGNSSLACRTVIGTPGYQAPEVKTRTGYGRKADVWSLGVILYIMLSAAPPTEDDQTLFELSKKGSIPFPNDPWRTISRSAVELICRMLDYDAKNRIGIEEIQNHPWMMEDDEDSKTEDDFEEVSECTGGSVSGSLSSEGSGSRKRRLEDDDDEHGAQPEAKRRRTDPKEKESRDDVGMEDAA